MRQKLICERGELSELMAAAKMILEDPNMAKACESTGQKIFAINGALDAPIGKIKRLMIDL